MQWLVERTPGLVVFLTGILPFWVVPILLAGVAMLLALGLLWGVYQLLRLAFPKVAAIAFTTAKEASSTPLFFVILGLGAFLILAFSWVPYNTFGEDIKMVKDNSLVVIKILALIMALWTASVSIADEIEGKTALTLLSKPIGRRQFVLGKFLGILAPVAVLFIVLGWLFLSSLSYKLVYDSRESSLPMPDVSQCALHMDQMVPGLILQFFETVMLTAVSVAISTRLPMLPNLIICFSIYVIGHLGQTLVNAGGADQVPTVKFIGQLIATIFPNLENFDVAAAIATEKPVPHAYLGWASLYCLIYTTFALLLALVFFEDRDLA